MQTAIQTESSRPGRTFRLYPEEVLALALFVATFAVNVVVHRTLNVRVLTENVRTYLTLFGAQLEYFFGTLGAFTLVYAIWQFLRFGAGRSVHLVVWLHTGKLRPALRAMLVYARCCVAFQNLEGFI